MPDPWLDTSGADLWEGVPPMESPPSGSGYGAAKSESNCQACLHQVAGVCHLWRANVDPKSVCYDWKPDIIDAGGIIDEEVSYPFSAVGMAEMLFSEATECFEDEQGLIWKPALRTGEWAMSPGPGQRPISVPLKVKLRTESPDKEIGLENLAEAFRARAMDHVTIPLSHADRVDENTGFVADLKIVPDKDDPSHHVLMAGYRFTEPEIKDKVKRGTIANSSVGVLFNYFRKRDGKKFPQALGHIALTNKPWIDGLHPFGVSASEGKTEGSEVVFCSEVKTSSADNSSDVGRLEKEIEELASEVTEGQQSLFSDVYDRLLGLGPTGPLPGGTPEKDNWVDAVGGLPTYIREVARELMKTHSKSRAIAIAISRIKVWAVTSKDPKVKAKAAKAIAEWEAKKVRARAKSLTASEDTNGNEEVKMTDTAASDDAGKLAIELSEARAELAQLRAEKHARTVDEKISEYAKKWGDAPGLLGVVKEAMLADDGSSVVSLMLSEEGGESKKIALSVTQVVERIMDAIPDLSANLSEQHDKVTAGKRPDDEEPPVSVADRAKAIALQLGDNEYLKTLEGVKA